MADSRIAHLKFEEEYMKVHSDSGEPASLNIAAYRQPPNVMYLVPHPGSPLSLSLSPAISPRRFQLSASKHVIAYLKEVGKGREGKGREKGKMKYQSALFTPELSMLFSRHIYLSTWTIKV